MSLLMDALRRAEDAKRRAGEDPAPEATSELTLTPMPSPPAPREASEGTFRPPPAGAPGPSVSAEPHQASARAIARNVFSAKAPPATTRRERWWLLALPGLAALGIGGYFWWQLQPVSGGLRPLPAATQTPTQAPAASLPPALVPAPVVPAAIVPVPAPGALAVAALPPEQRPPASLPAPRVLPDSTPPLEPRFEPRARSPRPSPGAGQAAPDGVLRLSKSPLKPGPTIERAYEAWQAGRLDEAQRDYEQVLRGDAKNTDALLGLATIAARQGQTELAQGLYLRALESNPNDATAQAGLINSRGQADPAQSESRLKTALAGQPESPALHFALGNLYARQARWSEAQQAYFRAYAGEPDNPDFIFNLAVSLDQLHQSRLAIQYYQMALKAAGASEGSAGNPPPWFDRSQVRKRILELQP